MSNYGPNQIRDFNTSFERSLSKLSENHKIIEIGSIILKVKAVERCAIIVIQLSLVYVTR